MIHAVGIVGSQMEASLGIMYRSLDQVTIKLGNIGIMHNLFVELGEKGFCLGGNVHCYVCYPLAPNNVPPTGCKC